LRTAKQIEQSRKERALLKKPADLTLALNLEAAMGSLDYHRERVSHYDAELRRWVTEAYKRRWSDARITAFTGLEKPREWAK
jgi:hypothetical protein